MNSMQRVSGRQACELTCSTIPVSFVVSLFSIVYHRIPCATKQSEEDTKGVRLSYRQVENSHRKGYRQYLLYISWEKQYMSILHKYLCQRLLKATASGTHRPLSYSKHQPFYSQWNWRHWGQRRWCRWQIMRWLWMVSFRGHRNASHDRAPHLCMHIGHIG